MNSCSELSWVSGFATPLRQKTTYFDEQVFFVLYRDVLLTCIAKIDCSFRPCLALFSYYRRFRCLAVYYARPYMIASRRKCCIIIKPSIRTVLWHFLSRFK
nr:unnamed protein product [Haemonchus contortus]